ncbi:MAG: class I SAM-dependent methyltransferase [Bryobacteraceae bacterium]
MVSRRVLLAAPAAVLRGQKSMFSNAQAYERFMGRWSRPVAPLLVDFAAVPDSGRLLDAGSGTGSLAFAIAERRPGCRVVGIDPSSEYIAYARSVNRFPDRVSFETGDAQKLVFDNAAFAASVSLLVFNFIPDPAKALGELRRVTESGGGIAAAVWDYGERMVMLRAFWDAAVSMDAAAEKLDEKHMPLCREGQLSRLWTAGGLEKVYEQPLEITTAFGSFQDYWDAFLLGQGPAGAYVRKLPGDRVQALRSAVMRRLSVTAESAAFSLPARVWAVRGTAPR